MFISKHTYLLQPPFVPSLCSLILASTYQVISYSIPPLLPEHLSGYNLPNAAQVQAKWLSNVLGHGRHGP